ncbi:hypothetical protein H480_00135 [Amycolatopsis vancoresmycina DSM 44592]|uniref:Uncharacterized protein n=1 Tax=Amycolatopsis vancoresmycina DSM 44592 TaxID=1292037 RepID=R1GHG8_9PSEU|nr:hypothetical protein H480_00135 [Amycolatopsis vancoresmycina DSM 44592]
MRDLAHRGRALADGFGDLAVVQREHLAQHEHRPLGRPERLQHQQHRHRHAVGELDVLGDVGCGQQRLGQPRPDVGLLAPAERSQPHQRLAGGDPDEVGTLVPHRGEVHVHPPQPRLLQDVFGVGGRAEQLVGDGEQQVAAAEEGFGGGVGHGGSSSFPGPPTRCRAPPRCDSDRRHPPGLSRGGGRRHLVAVRIDHE